MTTLLKYGREMRRMTAILSCRKILLSVFLCFGFLFCCGQAKLLIPRGYEKYEYQPNSQYNCQYLKARLSYLAGTTEANLVTFRRVSATDGKAIAESDASPKPYYRRTCLSTSYAIDWVDFPNDAKRNSVRDDPEHPNIDPENPIIVYAYSVEHTEPVYLEKDGVYNGGQEYKTKCYDVYWYTDDDDVMPKLEGDCYNLFQNGNGGKGSMLEDVSGIDDWDFSGVTSMYQMFTSCKRLRELGFTKTKDLRNVTNMSGMFRDCKSLDVTKFQECTRNTWWLKDDIKDITARTLVFNGVSKFQNVDFQIRNKILIDDVETNKTLHITNDGKYSVVDKDDPSSVVLTNMEFNMELATQIGRFTKIKWDMLFEENIGSFEIQYKKRSEDSFKKMADIDGARSDEPLGVTYYSYVWNETIVDGIYDFRVKAYPLGGGEPLISNVFSLDYSAAGIPYPACYTILRDGAPFDICTSESGNLLIELEPNETHSYEIPSDVIIVCEDFTVKAKRESWGEVTDHCNSTFINNGEVYANKDIKLYSNSMSTISYSCDGIYVAKNMELYGYKQPFKGIFQINEKFKVVNNGQGQDLTIDECARITADEGNFQHSGGAMKLYIKGDLIVDVLVEGNVIQINEGGMLIVGQTNLDPSLKIIGMSGSMMRLCYNPTLNGKDFMGYTNGTIYYNCNTEEHGWDPSNSPVGEHDVNDVTDPSYASLSSLWGGAELKPKVLAVYHSYTDCMDPTYDPIALFMTEDPFLPQDEEINPLYNKNCCSEEFSKNKIQIRELGNKWFRLINGELIYCENDNGIDN